MTRSLTDVARDISGFSHVSTKPEYYYSTYEQYLAPLRNKPDLRMMEVGVYDGDSLKVFGTYFENGRVLGIDIDNKGLDFSGHANVRFEQADQTDAAKIARLSDSFAPDGFDLVIDDASHYGWYSKLTFDALFPRVKPGGLYIVEDWGTGYIGEWLDGGPFTPLKGDGSKLPKRLPSHDYGMVGFVKSLIDGVWSENIRATFNGPVGPASPIGSMHVHNGMVVLRKAG